MSQQMNIEEEQIPMDDEENEHNLAFIGQQPDDQFSFDHQNILAQVNDGDHEGEMVEQVNAADPQIAGGVINVQFEFIQFNQLIQDEGELQQESIESINENHLMEDENQQQPFIMDIESIGLIWVAQQQHFQPMDLEIDEEEEKQASLESMDQQCNEDEMNEENDNL